MFYQPNYCCNCGEKIERVEEKIGFNNRFCDLCETDYKLDKYLLNGVVLLALVFGLFGTGGYLLSDSSTEAVLLKNEPVRSSNSVVKTADVNKKPGTEDVSAGVVLPEKIEKTEKLPAGGQNFNPGRDNVLKDDSKASASIVYPQKTEKAAVYFCGAETKKGTPCSRRVKGGGRCWQHRGREAMLSRKELFAGEN